MNPSDIISYVGLISATWGKWSPALFYIGGSQWVYRPKEAQFNGQPVTSPDGFRPTGVRQTSYFAAWLDYEANAWLTAEVGYTLTRSALNEDGSRGNPFFDKYQDQRVYLGANVNIDNIMKALEVACRGRCRPRQERAAARAQHVLVASRRRRERPSANALGRFRFVVFALRAAHGHLP